MYPPQGFVSWLSAESAVKLTLDITGYVVVILSLAATVAVGYFGATRRSRRSNSVVDYVLAGRALTTPLLISSLVATWYGAVLGSGEFVVRHGIVMFFCFGIPYYIAAFAYALWVVPLSRRSDAVSLPDHIGNVFGARARRISSVLLLAITIPAAYALMLGTFVRSITGWDLLPSTAIAVSISLMIVLRGGLRSNALANVVQVLLMFVGFFVLLFSSMATFGSVAHLVDVLPSSAMNVPGSLGWQGMIMWWVIALQTFVDPNFHQRVAAAASPSVARSGILWSIALWVVFDSLQVLTGLYARAFITVAQPIDAYVGLAEATLTGGFKGMFVAGVVAAVMSTFDGYAIASGTTITHDLVGKPSRILSYRTSVLLSGGIATILAVTIPSVVDLIYLAASITVPAFLAPVLLGFSRYATTLSPYGTILLVAPATSSLLWIVSRYTFNAPFLHSIDGMVVGLCMSCIIVTIILLRSRIVKS